MERPEVTVVLPCRNEEAAIGDCIREIRQFLREEHLEGEILVADNGSIYGTTVGGTKVEPGKPMVMHRGQEVIFGSDKNKAELH